MPCYYCFATKSNVKPVVCIITRAVGNLCLGLPEACGTETAVMVFPYIQRTEAPSSADLLKFEK